MSFTEGCADSRPHWEAFERLHEKNDRLLERAQARYYLEHIKRFQRTSMNICKALRKNQPEIITWDSEAVRQLKSLGYLQ